MANDHLVIITDVKKFEESHPNLRVDPFARQGCFYCMVCGHHLNYETPISIELVVGLHNTFIRTHRKCRPAWKKSQKQLQEMTSTS